MMHQSAHYRLKWVKVPPNIKLNTTLFYAMATFVFTQTQKVYNLKRKAPLVAIPKALFCWLC